MKFKKRLMKVHRLKGYSKRTKPKQKHRYVCVVEFGDIGFSSCDYFTDSDLELMRNPPEVIYTDGKYYVSNDDLPF